MEELKNHHLAVVLQNLTNKAHLQSVEWLLKSWYPILYGNNIRTDND